MKQTILFLAANPTGTVSLALDREARGVTVELERTRFRDSFDLVTRWAAEPLDLLRELRKLRPTIVHFSGHGGPVTAGARGGADAHRNAVDGAHRDLDDGSDRDIVVEPGPLRDRGPYGLYFQGPDGKPRLVSTEALQQTFGAAGASVKLVVLNACHSEPQAEALLAHVDCVVSMRGSILDDAARSFAIGFYGGLGEREPVGSAYKQGCAAISLAGLGDADRPQLMVRPGVDVNRLVLAGAGAGGR